MSEARFLNRRARREIKARKAWYWYPNYWLVFMSGAGIGGLVFSILTVVVLATMGGE